MSSNPNIADFRPPGILFQVCLFIYGQKVLCDEKFWQKVVVTLEKDGNAVIHHQLVDGHTPADVPDKYISGMLNEIEKPNARREMLSIAGASFSE